MAAKKTQVILDISVTFDIVDSSSLGDVIENVKELIYKARETGSVVGTVTYPNMMEEVEKTI